MADIDREASVKRTCPSAADRYIFDPALSLHPLEGTRCGIVFVHAFWAGQSHHTLKKLGESLARVDPERRVELIVCDIDEIEQLPDWQTRFYGGDITGGGGDASWIANGVVRARHNASRQCDFDTTTRSLLLECQGDGSPAS